MVGLPRGTLNLRVVGSIPTRLTNLRSRSPTRRELRLASHAKVHAEGTEARSAKVARLATLSSALLRGGRRERRATCAPPPARVWPANDWGATRAPSDRRRRPPPFVRPRADNPLAARNWVWCSVAATCCSARWARALAAVRSRGQCCLHAARSWRRAAWITGATQHGAVRPQAVNLPRHGTLR